jgi:hypothetical protein
VQSKGEEVDGVEDEEVDGVEEGLVFAGMKSRREGITSALGTVTSALDSCINLKNTGLDLAAALTRVFPCLIKLVQLRFLSMCISRSRLPCSQT